MSFGPTMVNDIIHTPELAGARLVLHDVNEQRLTRAYQFAAKLNAASGAPVVLDRTTDAARAFDGTDIVLSAAEFGRFHHRRQDYEVPNRFGARQINGENGGPGAVFHTLRSVHNTMGICAAIEQHCPDAFLVNLSNPLSRVALAIDRHTSVRSVSMCHEMPNGIWRLSKFLRMDAHDIEGRARASTTSPSSPSSGTAERTRTSCPGSGSSSTARCSTTRAGRSAWRSRRSGSGRSPRSPTSSTCPWWCTWSVSTGWSPAPSTATSASTCRSRPTWRTGSPPGST
jgi:hypothetical protein